MLDCRVPDDIFKSAFRHPRTDIRQQELNIEALFFSCAVFIASGSKSQATTRPARKL